MITDKIDNMGNFIKVIFDYVKTRKGIRSKLDVSLQIFLKLLSVPAFAFHELSHFVFLPYAKNIKVLVWFFFRYDKADDSLETYSLQVSFTAGKFQSVLMILGPMIFWLLAVIFFITFKLWILLFYFLIFFPTFYYSKTDLNTLKNLGCPIKITDALSFINKITKDA
jgi:hypothetical protein